VAIRLLQSDLVAGAAGASINLLRCAWAFADQTRSVCDDELVTRVRIPGVLLCIRCPLWAIGECLVGWSSGRVEWSARQIDICFTQAWLKSCLQIYERFRMNGWMSEWLVWRRSCFLRQDGSWLPFPGAGMQIILMQCCLHIYTRHHA